MEFSIPFAELRFPKNPRAVWGINFWRNDESRQEEQTWSDVGDRRFAASRFGQLIGLPVDRLVTKRPLEIKPYGTINPQKVSDQDLEMEADTGIDVRYPFSSMTVDFTLNPDFAQIEADPDVVNLTDIPLRFAEKRPFFLEGNELFQTPVELFYSRRVEDLMHGGKMIGKLGDYNYAVMGAQAGAENPDAEVEAGELPLDDYTYSVFRLQRELGKTSSVGLLGVNKQRGSLYDRASGIDARLSLPANMNLSLEYAREWKSGIDSDVSDDIIFVELARKTNVFSFHARYQDIGENFDVETGFIPRTDRRGVELYGRYNTQYPGLVQRLRGEAWYERLENQAGRRTNEHIRAGALLGIKNVFIRLTPEWYYHIIDDSSYTDEPLPYTDKLLAFLAGWFPPKWGAIRNVGSVGIRDGKDIFFINPQLTLRPTPKLSFEVTLQRLIEKEREVSEWTLTEWIRRFTFNYQFAQRMYFRATAEFAKERPFFELPIVQEEPSLALSVEKTRRVLGSLLMSIFPRVRCLLSTTIVATKMVQRNRFFL